MKMRWIGAALAALLTIHSWGQGIVDEYVTANELQLEVDFGGVIKADIGVSFENVSGLAPGALGITVDQIDPTDLALLNRMPSGGLVTIPSAFPIKLSIAPPADGELLMRGTAVVSFHTHNLEYTPGTPLRLFKAEHGGPFFDITDRVSSGSYRVRGSGGEFSEFVIVADIRPISTIVLDKFDRLQAVLTLNQSSIDSAVFNSLSTLLSGARTAFTSNGLDAAIGGIREMTIVVKKSGAEIPDVWRPRGDMVNVSGQLRSAASTLQYSLSLVANNL